MAWDFPGHDDNTHVWHNYEGHVSNVGVWKETVAISAKSSDWFVEYSSGIRRDWDNKCTEAVAELQDDVMTWKRFRRCWPFVRGIHRSPVDSPHKGPVNVFAQAKCWTSSGVAVDVMHHDAHITSLWCISYGQRKCIPKLSIMEETLENTCMLIFVVKSVCWIYIYICIYIYIYTYIYVYTPAVSWMAVFGNSQICTGQQWTGAAGNSVIIAMSGYYFTDHSTVYPTGNIDWKQKNSMFCITTFFTVDYVSTHKKLLTWTACLYHDAFVTSSCATRE